MSRTYRVCDRRSVRWDGTLALLVGTVFVISGAGGVVLATLDGEGSGPKLAWLGAVVVGCGCAHMGRRYLVHRPWSITVDPLGTLHVHRAYRVTSVRGEDVVRIERRRRRFNEEEDDTRELVVEHRGGTIPVPYFEAVDDFIADLQALNPSVRIEGTWKTR